MEHFHLKENYNIDDINGLISNEAEESTYLEFKAANALEKTEAKKLEIGKDISAFANSDGGVLIYGITEEVCPRLSEINSVEAPDDFNWVAKL